MRLTPLNLLIVINPQLRCASSPCRSLPRDLAVSLAIQGYNC